MRPALVEKLACPECRGSIEVAESLQENELRILQGTLRCVACGQRYPIEQGIPRMVKAADDVREIGRRFSFQWLSRWKGRFEGERCYGFDDDLYVGWVKKQLETRRLPKPGEWFLDGGCGSGEKAHIMATLSPEQNIVGVDMGVESLERAMARFGATKNLDYVQGNLLEPPFRSQAFDTGMSLGVLHHTPDTRRAFASFRGMLKKETSCVIWIYPTYREGPEWRVPYFVRDFLVLNQGHRLPTGFLRSLSYALIAAFYPVFDYFFRKNFRRIGKDLPFFDLHKMTRRERFAAEVFLLFDTILPRYQFRHPQKEVEGWLVEEGLQPLPTLHFYYTGTSVP